MSIDDSDFLGQLHNNLTNQLIHLESGSAASITRLCSHSHLKWQGQVYTNFKYAELHRLHHWLEQPYVDKFHNLLEKADVTKVDANARQMLEKIEARCKPCQSLAQKPQRFKFILRDEV